MFLMMFFVSKSLNLIGCHGNIMGNFSKNLLNIALSTGYLSLGGLPRNSVDRITDRPDMTSAVDRGRKTSTQTNKQRPVCNV